MRIAILGATSQLAKDLIRSMLHQGDHELVLFARRPGVVRDWLSAFKTTGSLEVFDFDQFSSQPLRFDAIINFVGVGNPAQAAAMGATIFDVTSAHDDLALKYLERIPSCKYIFLSSGAAYGSDFEQPVNENSKAQIDFNNLKPQEWYGAAKLHAECRHRSLSSLNIFDVRVFNYFSHTQDLSARFFITDALRAIRDKTVLSTSDGKMVRDYLHPSDFAQLIDSLLGSSGNAAVDCYSRMQVDKQDLLSVLKHEFGLQFDVIAGNAGVNATGTKPHYYSTNRRAAQFGFEPRYTSVEGLLVEARLALARESHAP